MVIHLNLQKDVKTDSSEENCELHSMPCKIHKDDEANVKAYFKNYIQEIDDQNFTSTFRGYPLQGRKVKAPEGYRFVVLSEDPQIKSSKDKSRYMNTIVDLNEFVYWNYDKFPTKNDAISAAFDWIDIAKALHSTEDTKDN